MRRLIVDILLAHSMYIIQELHKKLQVFLHLAAFGYEYFLWLVPGLLLSFLLLDTGLK